MHAETNRHFPFPLTSIFFSKKKSNSINSPFTDVDVSSSQQGEIYFVFDPGRVRVRVCVN